MAKTREEIVFDKERIEKEITILSDVLPALDGERGYISEYMKTVLQADDSQGKIVREALAEILREHLAKYFGNLSNIREQHMRQNREVYEEERDKRQAGSSGSQELGTAEGERFGE